MRIVIFTIGSRGDVQPYVALGLGLQAAGHEVFVATHEPFREFVTGYGLAFRTITSNPQEVLESEEGQRWLNAKNPISFLRQMRQVSKPFIKQGQLEAVESCRDADAVIFSPVGVVAFHVAEKFGVPAFMGCLQPQGPTREYPTPMMSPPGRPLPGWFNRLSHIAFDLGYSLVFRDWLNEWRVKTLGLPPFPLASPYKTLIKRKVPVLYGYSPSVVPTPSDWPPLWHVTGYWFLDERSDWQPPVELARFLEAGSPPVYVGFGSMATRNPRELTRIAVDALGAAGQRGILLSGWAGLGGAQDQLPGHVHVVKDVPHAWLFPRMAAVVHHGGAGTTAAGLRSGVPSIVTPVFGDQPFWGDRVARLGAGPPPIPQRKLTVEGLAAAIHTATTDASMRERAAALGERIRAEDGVREAVKAFERHLSEMGERVQ